MHSSLPVTSSDKKMSKKHLKARMKIEKASLKMNKAHKQDHEKAEKRAQGNIQASLKRLRTVERMQMEAGMASTGSMSPATPSGQGAKRKIKKVMGEFKRGTLHSGSKKGPKVGSRKQAVAIALSQAREMVKRAQRVGKPDRITGYIEHAGGPSCGSCRYLDGTHCDLPLVDKDVDPKDGCCTYWDDKSGQAGITKPPNQERMKRV